MRLCGAYRIRNKKNNYRYVGGSVHIIRRFKHHRRLLTRGQHPNRSLQYAWRTYGEDSFVFEILELCKISELDRTEQKYLPRKRTRRALRVGKFYNKNPIAGRLGKR
jgi:group I intron endonuclease